MFRNFILAVLAVSASSILPTHSLAQSGTKLRWQLPVGRKMEIEMSQRMKNSQNMAGKELGTEVSTTSFMNWEVEEYDEASGVAKIKSEIDRMTMKMKSAQVNFEIDSDSDQELEGVAAMIGENLLGMVGKPFGQTMNARGEVLTVDFPNEFNKQATMVMGADAMEKLIKSSSPVFPQEMVEKGKSWTQETTTSMPSGAGEMLLESTYTYAGKEMVEGKEMDAIDIDIKMTFKSEEGAQASIEISDQKTQGRMYFDAANGYTTSMKIQQVMTMDVAFGGQKISQTIENTTEGNFRLAK